MRLKKLASIIADTQTVEGDLRREIRNEHQETFRKLDATENPS